MKFNEYVALSEQLKKDGSSINEFISEFSEVTLFEAEGDPKSKDENPKLDTSGGKVGGLSTLNPKYIIKRKKLINNAKKYLKIANAQILSKFIDKIIKSQEHTAAAAVGAAEEGKSPKEIVGILKDSSSQARKIQAQQFEELQLAVAKVGKNFESRINTIVDESNLGSKEKLALNNYWIMLSQQVKQKIFSIIVKKQNEFIKKTVNNNPELEKVVKSLTGGKNYVVELEKIKQETEKAKAIVKSAQNDLTNNTGGDSEPKKHEVGKTYKFTYPKTNKEINITILEILENGSYTVKINGGTTYNLPKDKVDNIGDEIKSEAKPEAKPETETKPAV